MTIKPVDGFCIWFAGVSNKKAALKHKAVKAKRRNYHTAGRGMRKRNVYMVMADSETCRSPQRHT